VLKWVEPALGNEKTQRGRLKDSYSGVGFSWQRIRHTLH
jgi:hypothetical protein